MIPTVGRTVLYKLSEQDANEINARRKAARENAKDMATPHGHQLHQGNEVHQGDVYPMEITRTWGDRRDSAVNGQVKLDGNDVHWATSVSVGAGQRHFTWPQIKAAARRPQVGDQVHYVSHGTPPRSDGTQAFPAKCRYAVVTEVELLVPHDVHADTPEDQYVVGLCVLNPTGLFFHSIADGGSAYGPETTRGGSWHWMNADHPDQG